MYDNLSDQVIGPGKTITVLEVDSPDPPVWKLASIKPQPTLHNITFVDELLLSLPIKLCMFQRTEDLELWILCVTDRALYII